MKKEKIIKASALIFGGAGLSATAVMAIMRRTLVDNMLNREEPTLNRWIRTLKQGRESEAHRNARKQQSEKAFETLEFEKVKIIANDGTLLTGYYCAGEAPERVIIAVHGWRSSWKNNFAPIAEYLNERHCAVLYVDVRARGESGGDYMCFGMTEREDCLAWTHWVKDNTPTGLPVYLYGMSMGATSVLMASSFGDKLENVKGIIADSGFISADRIIAYQSAALYHLPYKFFRGYINKQFIRRIGHPVDGYSTLDAMKVNRFPILFIHGEADSFVPPEMSVENFDACVAPKKLFTVPGANHCKSCVVAPEAYREALDAFFEFAESN